MADPAKPPFNPFATKSGKPVHPSGGDGPRTFDGYPAEMRENFRGDKIREAGKVEVKMAAERAIILDRWRHKNEGTPETHHKASLVEQTSLSRLFMAGVIDVDQLAWAVEIGTVAEQIQQDVAVRIVDYEPRIDNSSAGRVTLVEGIMRVRSEIAYGWWREAIPQPKRAVLDMLTGEVVAFSTVARRYGMHKRRAKDMLIRSIDLWPQAMERAEKMADAASLAAAHAGLL